MKYPNIFPGARGKVDVGRGVGKEKRMGGGWAFASGPSGGGAGGPACVLGMAVSGPCSVCVWHTAQGRNLKQLSTWSSCSCVRAPPSSEPNSQGSQGKPREASLKPLRGDDRLSGARVFAAGIKLAATTQMQGK